MSEAPLPPLRPVTHPSVWTAAEMRAEGGWLIQLNDAEVSDIEQAVETVSRSERELLQLGREDFELPVLGERLRAVRDELLNGRGFAQLRGLPVERLGPEKTAIAFWGIGLHVGDEFASQNAKGHLLGHVRDLGESRANASQRGPYSRETIPYHVDACDIVGLLCVHPARSGGESSVASSGLIYNTLLERHPELVEPLTRPIYRDRRDEVPPGLAPWYAIPVFNHHAGLLSVNIEPTYIGSVGRHFDGIDPHTALQRQGIAKVQALAHELRFDIFFERGDIQFVNNHVIMHSRQAFIDYDEPDRKRHLLRLWLLNHDGRALPDAYYERHGTRETVKRPGGIVGPNTVLNAPIN